MEKNAPNMGVVLVGEERVRRLKVSPKYTTQKVWRRRPGLWKGSPFSTLSSTECLQAFELYDLDEDVSVRLHGMVAMSADIAG